MINTQMRQYNYFSLVENDYGQMVTSAQPQGQIKMAIQVTSQNIQDNINYKGAQYVGLCVAKIDDTYVIDYEGKKLKVLYVTPKVRYLNQVFMAEM